MLIFVVCFCFPFPVEWAGTVLHVFYNTFVPFRVLAGRQFIYVGQAEEAHFPIGAGDCHDQANSSRSFFLVNRRTHYRNLKVSH